MLQQQAGAQYARARLTLGYIEISAQVLAGALVLSEEPQHTGTFQQEAAIARVQIDRAIQIAYRLLRMGQRQRPGAPAVSVGGGDGQAGGKQADGRDYGGQPDGDRGEGNPLGAQHEYEQSRRGDQRGHPCEVSETG